MKIVGESIHTHTHTHTRGGHTPGPKKGGGHSMKRGKALEKKIKSTGLKKG